MTVRNKEAVELDHEPIFALHFLEGITVSAEDEIAKEEQAGMEGGAVCAFLIWRADETHVLLKQIITVGTFTVVENYTRELLQRHGVNLTERSAWGEIRMKLERLLSQNLEDLPGYKTVDYVRQLSNCFKHKGGWPDKNLVKNSNRPDLVNCKGDPLYYRTTFWRYIDINHNLKQTEQFLHAVTASAHNSGPDLEK